MKSLLVFAVLALAPAAPSFAVDAPRVFLGDIHGRVEVLLDGLEPWTEVKLGTELSPGTRVRTLSGASAIIAFNNGTKLEIGSQATWTFEESTPSKISVFLGVGRLTAWVKGLNGRRFQVRSQTAVASVRGTVFAMGVGKSGETSVWLYSGSLALTDGFGRSAVLSSGQRVMASPAQGMQAPKPLPPNATIPPEPPIAFKSMPPPQAQQQMAKQPPAGIGTPPPDAVPIGDLPPLPPPPNPTQNTATTCTNTVSPSSPCP